MKKNKVSLRKNKGRGPLARKVVNTARQQLQHKVVDFSAWKDAKIMSKDYQESIISEDDLRDYDPLHALYIYSQNKLSVLIEQIAELPVLHKLVAKYVDAEDTYMPSYPPMSPLSKTYFTSWGSFDLCSGGIQKETFCTIATDFCKFVGVAEDQVEVFEVMQNSYMGIYMHEGVSGSRIFLRELVTNSEIEAISASGYMGQAGEIWFARILPPLFHAFNYSLVFTTPYILGKSGIGNIYKLSSEADWMDYFERNLRHTGIQDNVEAYQTLMKYGLSCNYWNEYIFLAYKNYADQVIFLEGFPDIPKSLPHSEKG